MAYLRVTKAWLSLKRLQSSSVLSSVGVDRDSTTDTAVADGVYDAQATITGRDGSPAFPEGS